MERIIVVGTTGSGKTTLAGQIANKLGYPHIEQDGLNWGPEWTERPNDEFRRLVDEATQGERWVIDGNYSRSRDIIWPRADTVVWLDYPLPLVLWRLWWRIWRRTLRREELWSGNRERLYTHFFTRDSLFLWALKTYRRRRREYPEQLAKPEHAHLQLVHLKRPGETDKWLESIHGEAGITKPGKSRP